MLAIRIRTYEKYYVFFPLWGEKKKNIKHVMTENSKHHDQLKNNINAQVAD